MDKKQWIISICVVAVAICFASTIGFVSIKKKALDVEKRKIEMQIEEEKTNRTKERWDSIQRLPILRKTK